MIYEIGKGTGLYCSEGVGCRVYYIARPEPMLIDVGGAGRGTELLRDLASIGVQPINIRKIILTHHHLGHTGALWLIKRRSGAIALAHQADAQYIAGRRARRETRRGMERVFHTAMVKVGFGEPMLVQIERTIDDGDDINGWRVIHTPGHTPGHICLHKRDVLISGDMIMASAGGFHPAPESTIVDPVAYRTSLRRLAELECEMILPAHNPPYVVGASTKVRDMVEAMRQERVTRPP